MRNKEKETESENFAHYLRNHPQTKSKSENDHYGYSTANVHSEKYKYQAPTEGDSRSPCPFLNTMANHNILPRNGKDIKIKQMQEAVIHIGGVAPSIAKTLGNGAAKIGRINSDGVPIITLSELGVHNDASHPAFEHDASFTRLDVTGLDGEKQDNISLNNDLFDQLLGFQENGALGMKEILKARKLRLQQTKSNKHHHNFTLKDRMAIHLETILLAGVLGGPDYKISVASAESFLRNEKFPMDWQPRTKQLGVLEILKKFAQILFS